MNIWAAQTTQHNEYGFRFYGKVPTLKKKGPGVDHEDHSWWNPTQDFIGINR